MLSRDKKIIENRPCLFLEWNASKERWETIAPAVDCGFNCERCGWNPEEQARRLEEGNWAYAPNGIRRLMFKSREIPAIESV